MAGKLSKAIWLEKFELSSLSYLSLTGKMICRSKRLINTDIWFHLITGSSSPREGGMEEQGVLWLLHHPGSSGSAGREEGMEEQGILWFLHHPGSSGLAGSVPWNADCLGRGRLSQAWEQLPILAQHTHPGWAGTELCVLGSARDSWEEGNSNIPWCPNNTSEGWGWPSASCLHPGSPSEQISLC